MNQDRVKRVEIVNKIIKKISETRRGFFKCDGVLAEVLIEKSGLWWVDHYKQKRVYFHQSKYHGFPGFSSGGTLKELVFGEFKRFIMEGPIDENYTGLEAQYWAIPVHEKMELKKYALDIGYLKESKF